MEEKKNKKTKKEKNRKITEKKQNQKNKTKQSQPKNKRKRHKTLDDSQALHCIWTTLIPMLKIALNFVRKNAIDGALLLSHEYYY